VGLKYLIDKTAVQCYYFLVIYSQIKYNSLLNNGTKMMMNENPNSNSFTVLANSIVQIARKLFMACGEWCKNILNAFRKESPEDSYDSYNSAILCLILKSSIIRSLHNRKKIEQNELRDLIDEARKFYCTDREKSDLFKNKIISNDIQVESLNEYIEVYVIIEIFNGRNLIGVDDRYTLKRNLSANSTAKIIEIVTSDDFTMVLSDFNN
jgi:hypothetical protein